MRAEAAQERAASPAGKRSDLPFLLSLSIITGLYVALILAMLAADAAFTSGRDVLLALSSPEIRYAIKLSLISSSLTAILSLWVAAPAGYLLSRFRFPGKGLLDAVLDIPIVLPPLVIGLSLLILFQTAPGRLLEGWARERAGVTLAYGLLPLLAALVGALAAKLLGFPGRAARWGAGALAAALALLLLLATGAGQALEAALQARLGTSITYAVPGLVLAQFAVACAFAVRTMRVAFDAIDPRGEQVALTLGSTRAAAFWMVVLPEARRGLLTAGTLAWARSLGEFGPILVFAGATRLPTEVLPTTVFLELSVGNLRAAVAVSLLMVAAAVAVLVVVRLFGLRGTGWGQPGGGR